MTQYSGQSPPLLSASVLSPAFKSVLITDVYDCAMKGYKATYKPGTWSPDRLSAYMVEGVVDDRYFRLSLFRPHTSFMGKGINHPNTINTQQAGT
uniref:tRNA-synt_1g domain-containing protein n=1 Tax=Echinococcus granulosus TaxID=6210 RepID=A0A068WRF6_ECHGR|nr:hypothetical protein EgrG_002033000 [Echinococcus granulosus]